MAAGLTRAQAIIYGFESSIHPWSFQALSLCSVQNSKKLKRITQKTLTDKTEKLLVMLQHIHSLADPVTV